MYNFKVILANMLGLKEKIEAVLGERIIPSLQMHGGGVEIIDVDEKKGSVKLKLTGQCIGCSFADLTFVGLVEQELKEKIPELKMVEAGE